MAQSIDCLEKSSLNINEKEFLNLIELLKEKVALLPQNVSDDKKYNDKYSGLCNVEKAFYGFRKSIPTDEACEYYKILMEINSIMMQLYREYHYLPSEYLNMEFLNTEYFNNVITYFGSDFGPGMFKKLNYPQVKLHDIKMLSEKLGRVIVPLDYLNFNVFGFENEVLKKICGNLKIFEEAFVNQLYGDKLYVMCHYKCLDYFKIVNEEKYSQIYWPQSLENMQDMFEFNIINNQRIYSMFDQLVESINSMQQQNIKVIQELAKYVISLNNDISDEITRTKQQEIEKRIESEPERVIKNFEPYSPMKENQIYVGMTEVFHCPRPPYHGAYSVFREERSVPNELLKILCDRRDEVISDNETQKECFASNVNKDVINNIKTIDTSSSEHEKNEYIGTTIDTPIVFSTRDLFSNNEQELVTLGLCFGRDMEEGYFTSKGLEVKNNKSFEKIKTIC